MPTLCLYVMQEINDGRVQNIGSSQVRRSSNCVVMWIQEQPFSECASLTNSEANDYQSNDDVVPFRGRLKFRQYLPKKSHKYGIKLFKLCDNWLHVQH